MLEGVMDEIAAEIPYAFRDASAPPRALLVSVPHTGTHLSPGLNARLDPELARDLPDTDWWLDTLYDFVPAMGGALLCAHYSRYVVDLNRPADGKPLYPGRFETGLIPTESFDRKPLYLEGESPEQGERDRRVEVYYRPYHAKLREQLESLRKRFGQVLLVEAHSIRSRVPALFEGSLPDCVVGDNDGASCAPTLSDAFAKALHEAGRKVSRNAPFKGGMITRSYADPSKGVHALQLEMSQELYMIEEPPFELRTTAVKILKAHLQAAIEAALLELERRDRRGGPTHH